MPRGRPAWSGWFRNMGYRWTVPRGAILEVLGSTTKHLSAEEIYMKVHKKYPAIGLTTVYRTLELLVNSNMVMKLDFGDKRSRYELSADQDGDEHHHHLVCANCGRVIDYTDFMADEMKFLKKAEKGLSEKHNFKIQDHHIQFLGLCEKCK